MCEADKKGLYQKGCATRAIGFVALGSAIFGFGLLNTPEWRFGTALIVLPIVLFVAAGVGRRFAGQRQRPPDFKLKSPDPANKEKKGWVATKPFSILFGRRVK